MTPKLTQEQYNSFLNHLKARHGICIRILETYTLNVTTPHLVRAIIEMDAVVSATAFVEKYGELIAQVEKEGTAFDARARIEALTASVIQRAMDVETGSNQSVKSYKRAELAVLATLVNTLTSFFAYAPNQP